MRVRKLLAGLLMACAAAHGPARADEYSDEVTRFVQALSGFRAGDDGAIAALEASRERLCERHGRCDAQGIVAFYRAIPRDARMAGWGAHERFRVLRERVGSIGRDETAVERWSAERQEILGELGDIADGALGAPDFVPAAEALSLAARIELEQLLTDSSLDARGSEALGASVEAHALHAVELYERAGQPAPQLEAQRCLGQLALARGELAGARRWFEACSERAARVRSDDYHEFALQGLLEIARWLGDARDEQRLLGEIARFRDPSTSWPLARDWAARLLAEDHAREAIEFLERYAPPADAHLSDRYEWNLLLGSAQLRDGDLEGAREHFERLTQRPSTDLSVLALASLALREGRAFETLSLLDAPERLNGFSLTSRERAHALRGEARLESRDVDGAIEDLSRALDLALRNEAATRRERSNAVASTVGSVIGERLGLHTVALLADALARSGQPLRSVAAIENAQSRTLREGAAGARTIDTTAIERWAGHYELGLVTWVVGADFTFVAHVAPNGTVSSQRIELGRSSVERAVRRLREAALARQGDQRVAELADDVATQLLPAGIAERLSALASVSGAEPRVLLLAHGPTEALPFELLPWNSIAGRGDVVALVLPGLPASAPGEALEAALQGEWALFGAPMDAAGHEALPGAHDELSAVLELRPGSSLATGPAFRRERVLEALRAGRPMHLATHLVESPFEGTALVTSDGRPLVPSDLRAVPAWTPLVVLSACWSGGGAFVDAEGLFGLARAFLAGGARNLVVTQWPVEDAAAAQFGIAFHRALIAGATPSRAVARARAALIELGLPPAETGAFRLVGRD